MPEQTSQLAQEDYSELELAHNAQAEDAYSNYAGEISEALSNTKFRTLIKRIHSSGANRSGVMPFLAAVELDIDRRKPIGIKELFIVWLENGNKYWLNPMDKTNGLGFLHEILFKYQGDVQVLRPFIELLTGLARNGVSPRSFIEYVMLPRMRNDYNWRKWQDTHLEALRIIARLITIAKNQPPFNQTHLGSGKTRLARDVVLVRYIGRPLSQFPILQLRDDTMLSNYMESWRKISLQDPLSLYFMRNNALHFIYSMSGRIDLIQLVAIVEQLPDIERAFTAAFPDGNAKLSRIKAINLYDYDIEIALHERKLKGFHNLDYAVEIKAYFNIVKTLLEKPTGVYLCAFYANLLKRYKNPVIAEAINNLIRVVDDRGGMHIYKYHTNKLLEKTRETMQSYIDFIHENNGCDPDYPRLYLLFRDEENARETQDVFNLANDFGLGEYFNIKELKSVSYKDLLNAYIRKFPEKRQLITDYQNQLVEGDDRRWTASFAKTLDELNESNKSLYRPLLRSVIRGIGSGWSRGEKSDSFTNLINEYGEVNSLKEIKARTKFMMMIKPVYRTSAERDALARKQINLTLVERIWNSLCNTEQVNVNNTISFINRWAMELNEPAEKAFAKKVLLEEELKNTNIQDTKEPAGSLPSGSLPAGSLPGGEKNQTEENHDRVKLQKEINKQDKIINVLQEKRQNFNAVLDQFDSLNDEQKFIAALVISGTAGKEDDEFSCFVTALLLQRYKEKEGIVSRLEFLSDDISVDVLTYQQFIYLLNLLETMFFVLREDKKIETLLLEMQSSDDNEEENILQEILLPYIITKKKIVTIDALDAAAKKMTSYASMQAERAKWQSIIEKETDEKTDKYNHKMEIYTSKSFVDSHYGDMGGICLSGQPAQILRPGFYVQRLADLTDNQIIGMSLLFLSTKGFSTPQVWAQNYWHVFAFNPLHSVLSHLTTEQQLNLYLHFRLNIEKIAWMTKMPVVLSGAETPWGLISNNGSFGGLIREYELSRPTAKRVDNANGLSLYYKQTEYAKALVIIDPRGHENTAEPSAVPTFYAAKQLQVSWE